MKKKSFLVLTSGKFLEALGSGIGTGSIFCLSFSLSNRVSSNLLLYLLRMYYEVEQYPTKGIFGQVIVEGQELQEFKTSFTRLLGPK